MQVARPQLQDSGAILDAAVLSRRATCADRFEYPLRGHLAVEPAGRLEPPSRGGGGSNGGALRPRSKRCLGAGFLLRLPSLSDANGMRSILNPSKGTALSAFSDRPSSTIR